MSEHKATVKWARNGADFGYKNYRRDHIWLFDNGIELPASAASTDWQAAAQQLVDKTVKTVYITPGAGDVSSFDLLLKSGAIFIGSQPIPDALRSRWAATVISDPLPAIVEMLPDLLSGKGGRSLPMPVRIMDVNPALLSPGRLGRSDPQRSGYTWNALIPGALAWAGMVKACSGPGEGRQPCAGSSAYSRTSMEWPRRGGGSCLWHAKSANVHRHRSDWPVENRIARPSAVNVKVENGKRRGVCGRLVSFASAAASRSWSKAGVFCPLSASTITNAKPPRTDFR